MNEYKYGSRDFKPDYAVLDLNQSADWKTARAKYRHLVHIWHPDRYAQRPRERVHAQKQFIALTKSYTHLKAFHRQNGRLPFESTKARTPDGTMITSNLTDRPGKNAAGDQIGQQDSQYDADLSVADIESGILGRESGSKTSALSKSRSLTRVIWVLTGCAIMLGTLSVFFILDRKAHQDVIERGREAVRDAPASEFMPSAAEIRKSEAKGAFVQPTK